MTSNSETLQEILTTNVLSTHDLYVSAQKILDLTMGAGDEMTKEEAESFAKNKKKRKAKSISCGGFFHKGIYVLSNDIYENMMNHKELFPRMLNRQKTDCIHPLGKFIMATRKNTRGGIFTQSLIGAL